MTDEQESWSVNRGTDGMAPEGSSECSASLWARVTAPKGGSEPHSILKRMGGGEAESWGQGTSQSPTEAHILLSFIVGLKKGEGNLGLLPLFLPTPGPLDNRGICHMSKGLAPGFLQDLQILQGTLFLNRNGSSSRDIVLGIKASGDLEDPRYSPLLSEFQFCL